MDKIKEIDIQDKSQLGAPSEGYALKDRFSSDDVFKRLTASATEEIARKSSRFFFSGFAAGMIIGSTFIGRATMTNAFPEYANLLGNILYPIGFIAIVLGGYQLFTENTLTPMTLILNRRASIPSLLRIWGVVLFANIAGAWVSAFLLAHTGILDKEVAETAQHFGEHALSYSRVDLFFKASIAGGNVATMVWLIHSVKESISRFFIVYLFMFMIPACNLFHCVTGGLEVMYLSFKSSITFYAIFTDFFLPVILGNIIGGILFVTLINYGMTKDREIDRYYNKPRLSIKKWLFGNHSN